jgi:hypothetical protein
MRHYHKSLGWIDIGQHVTLMPDGKFVIGRDFGQTPVSIIGYNIGAFACEMLGNFDTGNDVLSGEQLQSILGLAHYFDEKGRYVRFHRENASKTCPCTSIDKSTFMEQVKSYGIIKEVERKVDNMGIKDLQKLCNKLCITDYEGKALVEDGINGKRTESARLKLKELLTPMEIKAIMRSLNGVYYGDCIFDDPEYPQYEESYLKSLTIPLLPLFLPCTVITTISPISRLLNSSLVILISPFKIRNKKKEMCRIRTY